MSAIDQDFVRDIIERHSDASGGNGRDFHNGAYAAMADEIEQAIAATLGATDANPTQEESSGTCHDIGTFKSWGFFTCSNCSIVIPLDAVKDAPSIGRVIPPKYCPNCGAKVVEPTTNDVDVEEDE